MADRGNLFSAGSSSLCAPSCASVGARSVSTRSSPPASTCPAFPSASPSRSGTPPVSDSSPPLPPLASRKSATGRRSSYSSRPAPGSASCSASTAAHGHTGLASVSGYTKITERRRGEARRALEAGGCTGVGRSSNRPDPTPRSAERGVERLSSAPIPHDPGCCPPLWAQTSRPSRL